MCFSEASSYTVAAVCAVAGSWAIIRAPSAKYYPLAAVPAVFALQQLSEGLVWRSLDQGLGGPDVGLWSGLFIFLATVFWPIFVPLAVLVSEDTRHRKRIISALLLIGSCVSLLHAARLLHAEVVARIAGMSIQYSSHLQPGASLPVWMLSQAQGGSDWPLVPYALATIGSLALSTLPALRYFSGLVLIALAVLMMVNQTTLVSVWCFLAASGSLLIVLAIQSARRRQVRVAALAVSGTAPLPADRGGS